MEEELSRMDCTWHVAFQKPSSHLLENPSPSTPENHQHVSRSPFQQLLNFLAVH